MSCSYVLNGHRFASELELDDYLITKERYRSKLGDIVFSITGHQANGLDILDTEALRSKDYEELGRIWDDDGKSWHYNAPYIGVNRYLSQLTFEDDYGQEHNLFPQFDDTAYWNGRFAAWAKYDPANGLDTFTEDEKETFFGQNTPQAIKDLASANKYKEMMLNRWENQCLYGDAVHAVFEKYLTRVKQNPDGTYSFVPKTEGITAEPLYLKDVLYNPDGTVNDAVMQLFRSTLSLEKYERRAKGTYKTFDELVNDQVFELALDKIKLIVDKVQSTFGSDCLFFPEYVITSKVKKATGNGVDTILGKIDLLVLDKNGAPHVIDYKTSVKPLEKFSSAKKLAYRYLTATYGRMLNKAGLSIDATKYWIIPVQLAGFKKVGEDLYQFDSLELTNGVAEDITGIINDPRRTIGLRLDEFIPTEYIRQMSTDNILLNVLKTMLNWFPQYNSIATSFTDEEIQAEIDANGGFTLNEETGKWEYKPKGSQADYTLKADNKVDLFEKVRKYKEGFARRRRELTNLVTQGLKKGIELGSAEGVAFPEMNAYEDVRLSTSWFKTKMARYCNQRWEVCDGPGYENFEALKEFGIIALFNRDNAQYNFVKISTSNLKYEMNFSKEGKAHNLAGTFNTDLHYESRSNSLMLSAAKGNVELMESMLVINSINLIFLDNAMVGDIEVMDPIHGFGIGASNKELEYCFNELDKNSAIEGIENRFKSGQIKLASKLHNARTMLRDIMTMGALNNWEGKYNKFKTLKSCASALDDAIVLPKDLQIRALENLIKELLKTDGGQDLAKIQTDVSVLSQEHVALYNQALLALAELKNINFRQLLHDHSAWFESVNVFKNGVSGLYLDNPGNLRSETLNLITKLVTQAYQHIRDDMLEPIADIRTLVENLKKEKNVGWVGEHTIVNQADLYKNMYRTDTEDLVFKNPWTDSSLTKAEKEFLKYALPRINANRLNLAAVDPNALRMNDDPLYFRVPLAKGDSSSLASKDGLFAALKDRLHQWTWEGAVEAAKAKAEGIYDKLDAADEESRRNKENLFEMNNIFDRGEEADREDLVSKKGKGFWETNLETLLLKHEFAYRSLERIDEVMPMVKAALVHITTSGALLNYKFTEDLGYAKDYIRNKIKNESIIDPKFEKASEIANKLKGAASKMVLALSPVLALYQPLQGIWNAISLILRKPDGSMAFTFKNMWKGALLAYKDLFNIEDKPSVTSLLNEQYGINDMDMNTYADHVKSDRHGIHNMTAFLYKFASRPDYYNRMMIFLAKMLADGCYYAHKIVNGRLVYDSKLDKRYEAYLKNPNGPQTEEYLKAKAAYYAAAKLFMDEGTLVDDEGNLVTSIDLTNPPKLPRAYTTLESESMKSLSDTIYGYYSHEKKSMMLATLVGSMWMLFKTFWSGKKNLYLLTGGVYLQGNWVPLKDENGNLLYYQVDEDGTVREDLEFTTTNTGVPVTQWEGDWKEGIFQTIVQFSSGVVNTGWQETVDAMWNNPDPKLQRTYRSNIKLLFYDLAMWIILGGFACAALGDLYDDEKKKADKDSFMDGVKLAMMNIAIKSVKNSALDFDFIHSISDPAASWTPFAFEYFGRTISNVSKVAFGDGTKSRAESAWDAAVNSASTLRITKPMWDALKPESFEQARVENRKEK